MPQATKQKHTSPLKKKAPQRRPRNHKSDVDAGAGDELVPIPPSVLASVADTGTKTSRRKSTKGDQPKRANDTDAELHDIPASGTTNTASGPTTGLSVGNPGGISAAATTFASGLFGGELGEVLHVAAGAHGTNAEAEANIGGGASVGGGAAVDAAGDNGYYTVFANANWSAANVGVNGGALGAGPSALGGAELPPNTGMEGASFDYGDAFSNFFNANWPNANAGFGIVDAEGQIFQLNAFGNLQQPQADLNAPQAPNQHFVVEQQPDQQFQFEQPNQWQPPAPSPLSQFEPSPQQQLFGEPTDVFSRLVSEIGAPWAFKSPDPAGPGDIIIEYTGAEGLKTLAEFLRYQGPRGVGIELDRVANAKNDGGDGEEMDFLLEALLTDQNKEQQVTKNDAYQAFFDQQATFAQPDPQRPGIVHDMEMMAFARIRALQRLSVVPGAGDMLDMVQRETPLVDISNKRLVVVRNGEHFPATITEATTIPRCAELLYGPPGIVGAGGNCEELLVGMYGIPLKAFLLRGYRFFYLEVLTDERLRDLLGDEYWGGMRPPGNWAFDAFSPTGVAKPYLLRVWPVWARDMRPMELREGWPILRNATLMQSVWDVPKDLRDAWMATNWPLGAEKPPTVLNDAEVNAERLYEEEVLVHLLQLCWVMWNEMGDMYA
ncbi:hypothetical protein MKEN_01035300 [Mycena kentingensis (nom. inval.)]|nr:hypothetical protein MKEN_01035300 [Mycena kentingensis (nom. inval.)]